MSVGGKSLVQEDQIRAGSSNCNTDASDPVSARISPQTAIIHTGTNLAYSLFVKFANTGNTEFDVTGCQFTSFSNDPPLAGESWVGNVYHSSGLGATTVTGSFTQNSVTVQDSTPLVVIA